MPLPREQEHQARELASARAYIIHEVILREGEEEMERSPSSLAWSGLAAGLTMGLSFAAPGLLDAAASGTPVSKLFVAAGYPLGFLIAIIGRQQLFTEDTLTPIVPLLAHFDRSTFLKVVRLWGVVLVMNLVGAGAFGWFCARAHILDEPARASLSHFATLAVQGPFWQVLVRGIVAGWMIALLTWVHGGMKTGEIAAIYLITYFVGIGNFPHIVVGSTETVYAATMGEISWFHGLLGFLLPTLIGNVLGGVGLVAVLNHAQVVAGSGHRPNKSEEAAPQRAA